MNILLFVGVLYSYLVIIYISKPNLEIIELSRTYIFCLNNLATLTVVIYLYIYISISIYIAIHQYKNLSMDL